MFYLNNLNYFSKIQGTVILPEFLWEFKKQILFPEFPNF